MKWPSLAATSRRSTAEALTTLTLSLTLSLAKADRSAPDPAVARRALFGFAFHAGPVGDTPPEVTRALSWIAAAAPPVAALAEPAVVRRALDGCAHTLAGRPAAATTVRRKRGVFSNALGYAVEAGLLAANPIERVQWRAPAVADTVDRRVVANPDQIAVLLAAVRAQGVRGAHLEAFFGCLYYAGLRPGEAVALRDVDCSLPEAGWGRLDLPGSAPKAGRVWTDTGAARDARGLKHRAATEIRPIPIPSQLVGLLPSTSRGSASGHRRSVTDVVTVSWPIRPGQPTADSPDRVRGGTKHPSVIRPWIVRNDRTRWDSTGPDRPRKQRSRTAVPAGQDRPQAADLRYQGWWQVMVRTIVG